MANTPDLSDDLMTKQRTTVTLSEEVHQILSEWAEEEERSLANLLSYLASKAARERQQEKKTLHVLVAKGSNER
jgi:predicted DNA-binding ribbon-helix-helix protein